MLPDPSSPIIGLLALKKLMGTLQIQNHLLYILFHIIFITPFESINFLLFFVHLLNFAMVSPPSLLKFYLMLSS